MRYGRLYESLTPEQAQTPEIGINVFCNTEDDNAIWGKFPDGSSKPLYVGSQADVQVMEFDIDQDTTVVEIPEYSLATSSALYIEEPWTAAGAATVAVVDPTDTFTLLQATSLKESKYVAQAGYDQPNPINSVAGTQNYNVYIQGDPTGTAKLYLTVVQFPAPTE